MVSSVGFYFLHFLKHTSCRGTTRVLTWTRNVELRGTKRQTRIWSYRAVKEPIRHLPGLVFDVCQSDAFKLVFIEMFDG